MKFIKIFITGGCKNGKTFFAQEIIYKLGDLDNKFYLATMKPGDEEDLKRINFHINNREKLGFKTIEMFTNISHASKYFNNKSSVLLDSTTALLANEMFKNNMININCYKKIIDELITLSNKVKHIVIVSDYIFSDAILYDEYTERYKFELAKIDRSLAKNFDTVIEISFFNKIVHKGGLFI